MIRDVPTPEALASLMDRLRDGEAALRAIPAERLLDCWAETVEAFLDPASPERRALDPGLARTCRLSVEGLAAAMEAVLGGVRREPAAALFAEAAAVTPAAGPAAGPVLVVLAANLPALAVQPLLPALALRRPVLLKSPSAEPLFAPAFLAALARREPRLAGGVAAAVWPGGDRELEAPVLERAGTVIAYGEAEAVASLEGRAPGRVVGYGPKTSLAVIGSVAPDAVTEGLARDIALFDQRGCLSIAAVYTAGDAAALAESLARALADLARRWPPGPAGSAALAAVQQARLEGEMRGLHHPNPRPDLPLAAGTVLVDPAPAFRPSPGLRTVRVHPLEDLGSLPEILSPWSGRLQGAALAGEEARALVPRLSALGFSRFAAPGELQSPDATWHNGGIHPLQALS
ncbi:MAG TPA: acyl-CoA reductase [Thermoanaerobaculia bacterium]|nr:acyl-CoA reductase [Thermoanaerobaculia bacterium]